MCDYRSALGDLRAQVAAVKTGEKRFIELVAKYGHDAVLAAIEAIFDHSETVARESVRQTGRDLRGRVFHGR